MQRASVRSSGWAASYGRGTARRRGAEAAFPLARAHYLVLQRNAPRGWHAALEALGDVLYLRRRRPTPFVVRPRRSCSPLSYSCVLPIHQASRRGQRYAWGVSNHAIMLVGSTPSRPASHPRFAKKFSPLASDNKEEDSRSSHLSRHRREAGRGGTERRGRTNGSTTVDADTDDEEDDWGGRGDETTTAAGGDDDGDDDEKSSGGTRRNWNADASAATSSSSSSARGDEACIGGAQRTLGRERDSLTTLRRGKGGRSGMVRQRRERR